MSTIFVRMMALRHDRRAVTALEYGLIAAAIAAVSLAGFTVLGTNLETKLMNVAETLT